jgi:hypothetical protein
MAVVTFTAVKPGIIGNLIRVNMVAAGAGPAATAVVTDLGLNQFQIDVTVNTAAAFTCAQVAAALMADAAVAALVDVTGDADPISVVGGQGTQRLAGGFTGQGQP